MSIEIVKSAKLKCSMCGKEETIEISETNVPTNYNILIMRGVTVHIDNNITYDTDNYVETYICDQCRDKVQGFINGDYKKLVMQVTDIFLKTTKIYPLSDSASVKEVNADMIKEDLVDYIYNYLPESGDIVKDSNSEINNLVNDIRKYGETQAIIALQLEVKVYYI